MQHAGSRWPERFACLLAILLAGWRVTEALEPGPVSGALPREVEVALQNREQGILEPHPALVAFVARSAGVSANVARTRLVAFDLAFDENVVEALASPDDRVALGACAWVCFRGMDLVIQALGVESAENVPNRRRALAIVAASCSGAPGATELANAALTEPADALGGAFGLWRMNEAVVDGTALPVALRTALNP